MRGLDQWGGVGFITQRKIFALENFRAEEEIDGEKMAPHKPVVAVDLEIKAAPEDGGKAVKVLPRFNAALLDLLSGHAARREGHHAIAISGFEPPAFVKQTPFILQPRVQRRSRKGREVIEGDNIKTVALGELQSFSERVAVVFVIAEDECHIQADLVAAQVLQGLLVAALHHVE